MSEPNGGGPARFDLAALAKASRPSTVRTAAVMNGAENPFIDEVRASYEQDKRDRDTGWREVEVPADQMWPVITSLRALSTWFGNQSPVIPIGVHIRVEYQPKGSESTVEVGPGDFEKIPTAQDAPPVFVKYTGRERMTRGRRKPQADAAPADAPNELQTA